MSNPSTKVATFNSTLDGFTGVEPIRYNSGLWLEDAVTNYCRNPSAETNTTGWSGTNTSVTQTTDHPFSGTYCFRTQRTSTAGFGTMFASSGVDNRPAVSPGEAWTVRVKFVATSGLTLRLNINWRARADDASTSLSDSFATIVTTGGEQEISVTATAPALAASMLPSLEHRTTGTVGDFWLTDCWEFLKAGYAGSYTDGAQNGGSGFAWAGTAHASTSTRSASSASLSPAGILSPSAGAIALRIAPTIETGLEEIWGEVGAKGSGTDHVRWGRDASKHPFVEWSSNDAAYQRLTGSETLNALTAYDLYLGHSATTISLAVDAGTLQTGTRDAISASWGAGNLTLEATAGGVIYNQFAAFNRTLSASEIRTLDRRNSWSRTMFGNPFAYFQLRPY